MKKALLTVIVGIALMAQAAAQSGAPKAKVLSALGDASKSTVLIGRALASNMVVLELEAAKAMWMQMGKANSPLAGDGTYETTITVGVPGFGRATADKISRNEYLQQRADLQKT